MRDERDPDRSPARPGRWRLLGLWVGLVVCFVALVILLIFNVLRLMAG